MFQYHAFYGAFTQCKKGYCTYSYCLAVSRRLVAPKQVSSGVTPISHRCSHAAGPLPFLRATEGGPSVSAASRCNSARSFREDVEKETYKLHKSADSCLPSILPLQQTAAFSFPFWCPAVEFLRLSAQYLPTGCVPPQQPAQAYTWKAGSSGGS